jgi:hypothetical protein
MSAWEEWKKSLGDSRPWHLLDYDKLIHDESVVDERMKICRSCEFFTPLTTQCKKCGCIMLGKTKLAGAGCPVHKWGMYDDEKH